MSPRQFVSFLLGGGSNLWPNVEYAAAFGTAVTGHPVIASIVGDSDRIPHLRGSNPARNFPEIAARLRPGLAAVLTEGTAAEAFEVSGARNTFKRLGKVKAYAKTGTLATRTGDPSTSRIVLAVVKWKDEKKGTVDKGVVISAVIERGGQGTATRWIADFLARHEAELGAVLR